MTVVVPCKGGDGSRPYPGKQFHRKPDGGLAKVPYQQTRLFDAHITHVAGLHDLDGALRSIASKRLGFVVPGQLRNPDATRGIRRLSRDRKGACATLESVPLHWLLFDLDKVPNVMGLDPRTEPDAARRWLLSLLPEAVRRADTIVRWSSSLCIGVDEPPAALSAHVWAWLSEPLDATEVKTLLIRADAHARHILEATQAVAGSKRVVDWKTTEAQQPIYVAPPLLLDGIADPFTAEERQVVVRSTNNMVDVTALRDEMAAIAVFPTAASSPKRRVARASRDESTWIAAPLPIVVRPCLPLPDARNLGRDHVLIGDIAALTGQAAGEQTTKRAADRTYGSGRMAAEIIRVALARIEWGKVHPAFSAWSETGSVPDGERDTWLSRIAMCLAHALPHAALLDGRLAGLVSRIGNALCSEAWTVDEWLRGGFGKSIYEKAASAARGETVKWQNREVDARYQAVASNMRRDLAIGDDEIRALRLLSLADGSMLRANRRVLASGTQVAPMAKPRSLPGERVDLLPVVQALRAGGRSLRSIVSDTGVPISTVRRWTMTSMGGDPSTLQNLEGSRCEERESSVPEFVHAAETLDETGQAAQPTAASNVRQQDGAERLAKAASSIAAQTATFASGLPIPGFILRRRADKAAAVDKAELFIGKAAKLVVSLAERCSVPLDEVPRMPCLDLLDADLAQNVVAAMEALRAAQRKVVQKCERQNRRYVAEAERDGFWEPLESRMGEEGADVLAEGNARLRLISGDWDKRISRKLAQHGIGNAGESRQHVVNLRRAKGAVLGAERRRLDALKRKLAA